jgi:hypothetical protein
VKKQKIEMDVGSVLCGGESPRNMVLDDEDVVDDRR